jgi:hypothetical protein
VVLKVLPTADPTLTSNYVAESLPDRVATLRALGHDLSAGPTPELVADLVAAGDGIPQRMRDHLDAGADHVCLNVIGAFQPGASAGMVEACAGTSGS